MDSTNDGSGVEANFDYLFLSPQELLEYKAADKNMPLHMIQSKKYGNARR
jgi:cellobiose-specific phosphotransferase system component IIB